MNTRSLSKRNKIRVRTHLRSSAGCNHDKMKKINRGSQWTCSGSSEGSEGSDDVYTCDTPAIHLRFT